MNHLFIIERLWHPTKTWRPLIDLFSFDDAQRILVRLQENAPQYKYRIHNPPMYSGIGA